MRNPLLVPSLIFLAFGASASAQDFVSSFPGGVENVVSDAPGVDEDEAANSPVYYVIERNLRVFASPEDAHPSSAGLDLRDGVRVLEEADGWSYIEWNNRRGYVPSDALSNVWIRVDKSERMVYVYHGAEIYRTLEADVSTSDEDKERRSALGEREHYRIPEGVFFVSRKNPNSRYYRAFVINYPNREHGLRGLREGLISEAQYNRIAAAERNFQSPPMGTALGGLIEIHGSGSGRQRAWTRGCVALRDVHMNELWDMVHVGTPVIIEP